MDRALNNDPKNSGNPEGIGVGDDSGFASISESLTATETDITTVKSVRTIADDVIFNNGPLQVVEKGKRKRLLTDAETKHLEQEAFNQQLKDKRYKRLMHLLERSHFYSAYLVKKMDSSQERLNNKRAKQQAHLAEGDENKPPESKSSKSKKKERTYNISEYVSEDMKDKMRAKSNLSQEDIEDELMSDPESNNIPPECPKIKYFNGELRDYQKEGLQWLKVLYENGMNGILADEMGLGKTIQVIALFCHLIEKKQTGPYLIIAPLSTIPNWMMEFERFAPEIPVVLFYGDKEHRKSLYKKISQKVHNINGFKTQPVVLTTFEVPMVEVYFMSKQCWRYIVIDEGHRIKNPKCQLLVALKQFQSMNRLLLTGTPLQNNLAELWSLLNFLLPEIFDDLGVFEAWFDASELQHEEGTKKFLEQEKEKKILSSLRDILKPFMLRRIKTDVCLDIPPKKEIIVYAPLTDIQHSLYTAVLNYDLHLLRKIEETVIIQDVDGKRPKRKCCVKRDLDAVYSEVASSKTFDNLKLEDEDSRAWDEDKDSRTWDEDKTPVKSQVALSVWNTFTDVTERNREFFVSIKMQNRASMYKKIVNHPYLVHCPLDPVGLPKIDEELIKSSGKLLVLDAMLAKLKARGHKVLLFSTWVMILDMIEDYLEMRDYRYVRLDGTDKIESRTENIKAFNSDPDVFLFLISTRAGGVGLNLATADTVIIYDSDWNPQVDIQAMARCHRIGQTRPVVVYKFCTKGTIDERVIQRAEAKRKLEKLVISPNSISMNLNDKNVLMQLKQLLESSDHQIVRSAQEVFTEEELDKLLDRSDMMEKPSIQEEPSMKEKPAVPKRAKSSKKRK